MKKHRGVIFFILIIYVLFLTTACTLSSVKRGSFEKDKKQVATDSINEIEKDKRVMPAGVKEGSEEMLDCIRISRQKFSYEQYSGLIYYLYMLEDEKNAYYFTDEGFFKMEKGRAIDEDIVVERLVQFSDKSWTKIYGLSEFDDDKYCFMDATNVNGVIYLSINIYDKQSGENEEVFNNETETIGINLHDETVWGFQAYEGMIYLIAQDGEGVKILRLDLKTLECEEFLGNIYPRSMTFYERYVYYADDSYTLCRKNLDTLEEESVLTSEGETVTTDTLAVVGNKIFFLNKGSLYCLNENGKLEAIYEDAVLNFICKGNALYFMNSKDGTLADQYNDKELYRYEIETGDIAYIATLEKTWKRFNMIDNKVFFSSTIPSGLSEDSAYFYMELPN